MTTNNAMFPTREQYLKEAANLIIDDLLMPIVEGQYERPNFRISVGFPKHSRGGKAIATCFVKEASTDGVNEIFINPEIDEPVKVMEAIVHELIHAVDNCESGHQNFFAKTARKVGLEGPLTKTYAGGKLSMTLNDYKDLLGAFPHAKMNVDKGHKKDGTRQRKVWCTDHDCGFLFRTSAKQIDKLSLSATCPACENSELDWD